MKEQVFKLFSGNEKTIEKILMDENIHYLHMIFRKNEGTPEHYTNSNVYMTVIQGTLSITLDEQEKHNYTKGSLLKIPFNTKMIAENLDNDTLELIIVKAPAPRK